MTYSQLYVIYYKINELYCTGVQIRHYRTEDLTSDKQG